MGGEAGSVAATGNKVSEHVKTSFGTMRFIVTVGWSIYPLGYFFGYLMGGVDDDSLNLVYNLADFINKIAFCLAIWASAKKDTSEKSGNQPCQLGLAASVWRSFLPASSALFWQPQIGCRFVNGSTCSSVVLVLTSDCGGTNSPKNNSDMDV